MISIICLDLFANFSNLYFANPDKVVSPGFVFQDRLNTEITPSTSLFYRKFESKYLEWYHQNLAERRGCQIVKNWFCQRWDLGSVWAIFCWLHLFHWVFLLSPSSWIRNVSGSLHSPFGWFLDFLFFTQSNRSSSRICVYDCFLYTWRCSSQNQRHR